MTYQELKEYYRTLVVCQSELCWPFEKEVADQPVRKLINTFRKEMKRVEDELDQLEIEEHLLSADELNALVEKKIRSTGRMLIDKHIGALTELAK